MKNLLVESEVHGGVCAGTMGRWALPGPSARNLSQNKNTAHVFERVYFVCVVFVFLCVLFLFLFLLLLLLLCFFVLVLALRLGKYLVTRPLFLIVVAYGCMCMMETIVEKTVHM